MDTVIWFTVEALGYRVVGLLLIQASWGIDGFCCGGFMGFFGGLFCGVWRGWVGRGRGGKVGGKVKGIGEGEGRGERRGERGEGRGERKRLDQNPHKKLKKLKELFVPHTTATFPPQTPWKSFPVFSDSQAVYYFDVLIFS